MSEEQGAVIGINLGNTYGSIACINQHGRADVIANESGERQIATRIAFNGDQVYHGNEATPQLVRNAMNVIDNFVNLVGRPFDSLLEEEKARKSSPVLNKDNVPSFEVESHGEKKVLSAHDVLVRYIGVLYGAAKDFMSGVPIVGAVLSTPSWYTDAQNAAVFQAAQDAGLRVLQLVPASAAVLAAYGLTAPSAKGDLPAHPDGEQGVPYPADKVLDRNVVVVDFGGTSLDVSVYAARAGVYAQLAYTHDKTVGGRALDDVLVQYFAKEFAKKTKITIGEQDARAWAKLRNEAEITKRALSASNSAQCSVESLAEGVDFSGSVNRMRLNLLAAAVYQTAVADVQKAIEQAGLEPCQVDEVVLAGGASRLAGLAEQLSMLFPEDGNTHITYSIDSDQVIARGCAVYAQSLVHLPSQSAEREFVHSLPREKEALAKQLEVPATTRPVGLVLDDPKDESVAKQVVDGHLFVTLVPEHTAVPARRVVRLPVARGAEASLLRFAEGTPKVRVDFVKEEPLDDEDEEELEPVEVRTAYVCPEASRLVELVVPHSAEAKAITVHVVIETTGQVRIEARVDDSAEVAAQATLGA
ncbi:Hsp70 protein that interacts with Zuo1p [Malassezia equina]|uniref:Hsp70 protein that interacts with Zuo1p n=1 Tax=Malassezia equina TaxID=1381935 RepID=A0AAF0EJN6_9BASI|nr:Hsp70 protein that interacts with Zuo1p [Malassezia equina]